ncbi:hypothetical protein [Actinokineospora sp.]|uniref:hypothetical protein n=1 Tax=Actinokineospora sp. TaxID=1872133 RepID=UPI003D6A6D1E
MGTASAAADPGPAPWAQVPRDQVAAECGLDPALLDRADAALPSIPFTIVRHGKLCWVNRPADTTSTYHVASVTKTFAATPVRHDRPAQQHPGRHRPGPRMAVHLGGRVD